MIVGTSLSNQSSSNNYNYESPSNYQKGDQVSKTKNAQIPSIHSSTSKQLSNLAP